MIRLVLGGIVAFVGLIGLAAAVLAAACAAVKDQIDRERRQ